jgi:hypothetical protein
MKNAIRLGKAALALGLASIPGFGAAVVNNVPVENPIDFTLDSRATNDDPGVIYYSAELNIYKALAASLWNLPSNQATYADMTDMLADWSGVSVRGPPSSEVYTGWAATLNADGSVSIRNNDFDWDTWYDTNTDPSQDMQAYTLIVPKSQLECDGVAGYNPLTDASIVLSDSTRLDAFVGDEGGAGGLSWQGEGTFYQVAVPVPNSISITQDDTSIIVSFNGVLEESTDLKHWATLNPQPPSPYQVTLEPNQRVFYRLEDGQHGP